MKLISKVPGFEGECKPTWINNNQVYNVVDDGTTGFFRLTKKVFFGLITVRTGVEFSGILKNKEVHSTYKGYR